MRLTRRPKPRNWLPDRLTKAPGRPMVGRRPRPQQSANRTLAFLSADPEPSSSRCGTASTWLIPGSAASGETAAGDRPHPQTRCRDITSACRPRAVNADPARTGGALPPCAGIQRTTYCCKPMAHAVLTGARHRRRALSDARYALSCQTAMAGRSQSGLAAQAAPSTPAGNAPPVASPPGATRFRPWHHPVACPSGRMHWPPQAGGLGQVDPIARSPAPDRWLGLCQHAACA